MTQAASSPFSHKIKAFAPLGPLKTWSLVATVFGDVAPAQGQWIESHDLGLIAAAFDVKPEAFRVALHRLKKDGWLVSEKRGRRSAYALSAVGEAETRAVYERIYRAPQQAPTRWHICLEEARAGAVGVGAHVSVYPESDAGGFGFAAEFEDVPQWLRGAVIEGAATPAFDVFTEAARAVQGEAGFAALCGRFLVLHYWRRLLLRQAEAPEMLLGTRWPGYEARCAALACFARVPRCDAEALSKLLA